MFKEFDKNRSRELPQNYFGRKWERGNLGTTPFSMQAEKSGSFKNSERVGIGVGGSVSGIKKDSAQPIRGGFAEREKVKGTRIVGTNRIATISTAPEQRRAIAAADLTGCTVVVVTSENPKDPLRKKALLAHINNVPQTLDTNSPPFAKYLDVAIARDGWKRSALIVSPNEANAAKDMTRLTEVLQNALGEDVPIASVGYSLASDHEGDINGTVLVEYLPESLEPPTIFVDGKPVEIAPARVPAEVKGDDYSKCLESSSMSALTQVVRRPLTGGEKIAAMSANSRFVPERHFVEKLDVDNTSRASMIRDVLTDVLREVFDPYGYSVRTKTVADAAEVKELLKVNEPVLFVYPIREGTDAHIVHLQKFDGSNFRSNDAVFTHDELDNAITEAISMYDGVFNAFIICKPPPFPGKEE